MSLFFQIVFPLTVIFGLFGVIIYFLLKANKNNGTILAAVTEPPCGKR